MAMSRAFRSCGNLLQLLAADLVTDGQHASGQRAARLAAPHDAARETACRLEDTVVDAAELGLQSRKHGLRSPEVRLLVVMRPLADLFQPLLARRHDRLLSPAPEDESGVLTKFGTRSASVNLIPQSVLQTVEKPATPPGCSKRSRCKATASERGVLVRTPQRRAAVDATDGPFQRPAVTSRRRRPHAAPAP